jgi:hypothetical protein
MAYMTEDQMLSVFFLQRRATLESEHATPAEWYIRGDNMPNPIHALNLDKESLRLLEEENQDFYEDEGVDGEFWSDSEGELFEGEQEDEDMGEDANSDDEPEDEDDEA